MKAVVFSQHGGPEVLQYQDVPDPKPGPGEVLIDVMTCVFRRQLKPVIDRVLPLAEARAGHELIERRSVFGKIVLTNT